MKAVVHSRYGSSKVLQLKEVDKPLPKENEILIKVYATTVNRTDCAMLYGKPIVSRLFSGMLKPNKLSLGSDVAGKVEAIGEKVSTYKVGDRIFGFNDLGLCSHAEYIILKEDEALGIIPANISYEQAAASIEGAHYAYNFINKINLAKGEQVLVNGATGAIGSACVQLAKYYGACIDAVCKSRYTELIKHKGANNIIDYTKVNFTNSKKKYHYVFDTVGKSSFSSCKKILLVGGVYISSELGNNSENLFLSILTTLFGNKKVKFPFPTNRHRSVRLITKLLQTGEFLPIIDKTYPIEKIIEAFDYVGTGEKIGNVIINMQKEK